MNSHATGESHSGAATVLLIEDDASIRDVVAYRLGAAGHEVSIAEDGVTGLEAARGIQPDLVILDIMLPRLNGLDLLRVLRRESAVPVLVLSAREQIADKVAALELGADDYVAKPFSLRELLARVDALLRRAGRPVDPHASAGPEADPPEIAIDEFAHEVRKRGRLVALTPKEYELLLFLHSNPRRVFSRDALLNAIWGYDYDGDTRTVDVHVYWLRRKLEDEPALPRHFLTVRQVGYRFESGSTHQSP